MFSDINLHLIGLDNGEKEKLNLVFNNVNYLTPLSIMSKNKQDIIIIKVINNKTLINNIGSQYINDNAILILLGDSHDFLSEFPNNKTNISFFDSESSDLIIQIISEIYKRNSNYIKLEEGYIWNLKKSILFKNKDIIVLSKNESLLLSFLIKNKNTAFTKQSLFSYVHFHSDREYKPYTIRNLVKSIRKKAPNNFLINEYSLGYKVVLKKEFSEKKD